MLLMPMTRKRQNKDNLQIRINNVSKDYSVIIHCHDYLMCKINFFIARHTVP